MFRVNSDVATIATCARMCVYALARTHARLPSEHEGHTRAPPRAPAPARGQVLPVVRSGHPFVIAGQRANEPPSPARCSPSGSHVTSSGTGEAPRAPSAAAAVGSPARRARPGGPQARAPAHARSSTPSPVESVGGSADRKTRRPRGTVGPYPSLARTLAHVGRHTTGRCAAAVTLVMPSPHTAGIPTSPAAAQQPVRLPNDLSHLPTAPTARPSPAGLPRGYVTTVWLHLWLLAQ
ncbi:hypothetical protein SAMN06265360_10714 [Haloechinothrix alba]|uniref:Uncharacterized protein n=1 Tax=Haloechinothrix alba TaxID=664784 RepID=A0A238WNS1_9PSEU|nr:hypothetical protein SAMN06265360_10714 [Haloechinothrix alba]